MAQAQTITLDLDTGLLTPQPLRLPVGFDHLIQLNLRKSGSDGYELPGGSSIEMIFDDTFPIDGATAIHKIENISWIWNAALSKYEAGFNASQRPLSIIALTTFASRLVVIDGGVTVTEEFHTSFRSCPPPPGLSPCASPSNNFPAWFLQWLATGFRFSSLPDQPTLPAAGVSATAIQAALASASPAQIEAISDLTPADADQIQAALTAAPTAQKEAISDLIPTDAAQIQSALTAATQPELEAIADTIPIDPITDITDLADRTDQDKIYRHAASGTIHTYFKDASGGEWVSESI